MRVLAVLAFVALAGGATADAQPQVKANPYEYVVKVQAGDDNYLYVSVKGNFDTNVHQCPNSAFARSKFPLTDERTKAMTSIALASFLARKRVHTWTQGCYAGGYAILMNLQVNQD